MDAGYPRDLVGYGPQAAEGEMAGRRARRRSTSSSTTRRAARTRSCTATRRAEAFLSEIVGAQRARGRAAHVDGVDLRVRLARRRVAHPRSVRALRAAADRLRRGDGDGAQSGRGRGLPQGRPRDRQPRLALDQLPARADRESSASTCSAPSRSTAGSPASGRSAGTPGAPARTRAGWWSRTAASSTTPTITTTTCPGTTRRYGKPQLVVPYTLDANDMRFATAQGFNTGEQFFQYLKDSLRRAVRGRPAHAPHDVGRAALPAGRPARAPRGPGAVPEIRDAASKVWITRRIDIARHWLKHHPHG